MPNPYQPPKARSHWIQETLVAGFVALVLLLPITPLGFWALALWINHLIRGPAPEEFARDIGADKPPIPEPVK